LACAEPQNSVMIGDSESDMVAAHNAGMPGVHLLYLSHMERHDLATASINCYEEAPTAIGGILQATSERRRR
jgi:phosphoglycolate phosphatase-like HAD superfamily hydrolase